tara:strand:- start:2791 stop:3462 length:672 start_codon:yes stop_codon:yes gene_type:complete
MVSFNSGGSGSGQFSTLSELIDDALREMGESSPTVLKNLESERFLNYANRVVADINRHPSFLDVLDNTYDDQTGSISSGSNDLVVTSGTVTFSTYTPVKIAGAGASNSDLHSFVLGAKTVGGSTVAGTYRIADTADTTVSGAVISNPYKTRIKRYTAIGNHRAVDDEVMLEGLKSYYSIDDTDTNNTGLITLRSGIYTNTLNNWIGSITNIQGALTVEINEYT